MTRDFLSKLDWVECRKRILSLGILVVTSILLQNCSAGFGVESALSLSSSGPPSPSIDDSTTTSSYVTQAKQMNATSTAKAMAFDLESTGAKVSVTVSSFTSSDGSITAYYFSKPTFTAPTGKDISYSGLRIWLNGSEYGDGTTYVDLVGTLTGGTTTQISSATMVMQPTGGISTSDTLAIGFSALSVGSDVLSDVTPIGRGEALYQTYCAACHGALETSTKRGTTANAIKSSFSTVSNMSYLANELDDAEIEIIAAVLR